MQTSQVFVCGRCSYRSHHKGICHNCRIHLEKMCEHCYAAEGNCVCLSHGQAHHKIAKIKQHLQQTIATKRAVAKHRKVHVKRKIVKRVIKRKKR